MDLNLYLLIAVIIVFAGSIFGIFRTKTPGFGKYTTATLVLTLVLFAASVAFLQGKIELQPFSNLLFAVAGYAGGLVTIKASES